MPAIESQIDTKSPQFLDNVAHNQRAVDDLRAQLKTISDGGGEKARAKHTERGKLLARERIRALLDPGSAFLELSSLAAFGMYDGAAPCAGVITGSRRTRHPFLTIKIPAD